MLLLWKTNLTQDVGLFKAIFAEQLNWISIISIGVFVVFSSYKEVYLNLFAE
jgi:hypothetical protein